MKVIIVGGGLVGALQAIYMARRGFEVHLVETRTDMRKEARYSGLSINLALSARGIAALKEVGIEADILGKSIPMKARMIHATTGALHSMPYDTRGQAILSIDRRNLNEHLLTEAEKYPNVHVYFSHKAVSVDVPNNTAIFTNAEGKEVEFKGDLIFGADGAHSVTRRSVQRYTRMNYWQHYVPHGYKELTLPASETGEFKLAHDHLHIWPRKAFMMIALPNLDNTFTMTLFMAYEAIDSLKTEDDVLKFFRENFPDAVPLIGEERLKKDFFANPTGQLMTIKCNPIHANRTVLIGDAAHAVVPFYGQGMNAAFEDCLVFDRILNEVSGDIDKAIAKFSGTRYKDGHAIADLALYNYHEMSSLVTSRYFIFRKNLDNLLYSLFPSTCIPLYTMVTFTQIPYSEVVERHKRQYQNVTLGLATVGFGAVAGLVYLNHRFNVTQTLTETLTKHITKLLK